MLISCTRSRCSLPVDAALLLLAVACSGPDLTVEPADGDSVEVGTGPDAVSDAERPEAVERDHDSLREQPLEANEREAIATYLGANGLASDNLDFLGRLVVLQGDVHLYADDLLPYTRVVDKGKVPTSTQTQSSGFPGCSVATCGGGSPFQFAFGTIPPQNLAFRRPDTQRIHYLVVDDNAPNFFTSGAGGGMVGQAANAVETALSTDCLTGATFTVLRNTAYQALPLATRQSTFRTRILSGEFSVVCADAAVGCSNFPRLANVTISPGVNESRLRFGDRIALVTVSLNPPGEPTTALTQLNEYSVGIMTHELLHTMGFHHPQIDGTLEARAVPGTASGTTHLSVMHGGTIGDPNYRPTLQSDDRTMLTKLYSGSCAYSANFRTVVP